MCFGLGAIFEDEGFDRASIGEVKIDKSKTIFTCEREVSFAVVTSENEIDTKRVLLEISYTKEWSRTMKEIRNFNHSEMIDKFCNNFKLDRNKVFNTEEDARNHIEKNMYNWDELNNQIEKAGGELYSEFHIHYGKVRGSIIGFKGERVTSSNFKLIVNMLPIPKDGYTWCLEELRFTTIVLKPN
jgi:hypothetical protein